MVTLCCTKRLLKRAGTAARFEAPPATCALGNWFANIVYLQSHPIVLAVSQRTFVAALFPARSVRGHLVPAFVHAAVSLLLRLGASPAAAERERALMSPALLAPTNSRQVLGIMNQYALESRLLLEYRPSMSLADLELHFASGLVGPLGLVRPQEAALACLAAPHEVM